VLFLRETKLNNIGTCDYLVQVKSASYPFKVAFLMHAILI